MSLGIETGAHFQFRNTGNDDFEILIVTMPPWKDASEAERVPDHWPLS
jgi:mannose-6-phosphate isomerase-like protein (cupin superfamily)